MKNQKLEKRALTVSIVGAAVMAILGVYYALVAESEAIMLDGVFSGIGFVMASLTLKVAGLVNRPDDEHFHYGYSHFAPLLNVFKAILILVLCTIALVFAIKALFTGGRSMAMGSAVVYGVLATVGCLIISLYIWRAKNLTGSALVAVDAESWAIDTLLSGAVLVAFIIGWAIQDTAFSAYLDYLDPGVVAVLCLMSVPVPLKILFENAREVLLFAPNDSWRQKVEDCFLKSGPQFANTDYRIRLLKMGNTLNILVHVKPGPDFDLHSVDQLDDIRFKFNSELETMEVRTTSDIVFVGDMKLSE